MLTDQGFIFILDLYKFHVTNHCYVGKIIPWHSKEAIEVYFENGKFFAL